MEDEPLLRFRLDRHSGLPVYRQLEEQVRQALRLGLLRPGDQLPPVRDVVKQVAINPNTVHRAYRELEHQGLVEGQPGRGTFVRATLPGVSVKDAERFQTPLTEWMRSARAAELDDEAIDALVAEAKRSTEREGPA